MGEAQPAAALIAFVPAPERAVFLGSASSMLVHYRHQCRAAVTRMCWAARTISAFQGLGLNEGRQLSAAQLPPFPHSIQGTRASDRSDLCRLMSRVKQKPNCCQQQREPATVCQNVDAGLQRASLAEHPDTLLRRQKIKPKQNKKSKIEEKCYMLLTRSLPAR